MKNILKKSGYRPVLKRFSLVSLYALPLLMAGACQQPKSQTTIQDKDSFHVFITIEQPKLIRNIRV